MTVSGELVPFAVARPALALPPLPGLVRVDPLRLASAPFLARVERLDARVHRRDGLASPRWVLFDCAELPGAVVGLAAPDGAALVPLGLLAATPMLEPGHWLLHMLGCDAPERVTPVALLEVALRLLRPARVTGTAQWRGDALAAFAALAPLRLSAAWLPAHSVPATCVFELAAGAEARAARRLDAGAPAALAELQAALEAGARVLVLGGADAAGRVPIAGEGGAA